MCLLSVFVRIPRALVVGAALFAAAVGLGSRASFAAEKAVAKPSESSVERLDAGYTLPFQKVVLRFESQGVVKTREVKEGDAVKMGQLLLTLDDRKEVAELEGMVIDASDIAVRAQKVNAEVKNAELKRIKHLLDSGNGGIEEYEKAKAEADLAALQILKEEQDVLVKKKKIEKQQAIIDSLKLHSPADGIVQAIDAHVGEMVDPSKPPVLVIVQNDPLIVEVPLPISVSQRLKMGRTLRVTYDKKLWLDATVSFKEPMADAESGMQRVHLTLPNPDGKDSGLQVYVEVPKDLVAANDPSTK